MYLPAASVPICDRDPHKLLVSHECLGRLLDDCRVLVARIDHVPQPHGDMEYP